MVLLFFFYRRLCCVVLSSDHLMSLQMLASLSRSPLLPPTSLPLTTGVMAASSDRNPPPFPATEEPGAGPSDMADGDSDEGEDIFVNNVCLPLNFLLINYLTVLSA